MSATYDVRRAEGRCTDCGGKMLPEWGAAICCPTCAEDRRVKARTVWKRDLAKKRLSQTRHRLRRTAAMIKAGLCVKCGDESEVREDGKRRERCLACTRYAADQQHERWLKRRTAA